MSLDLWEYTKFELVKLKLQLYSGLPKQNDSKRRPHRVTVSPYHPESKSRHRKGKFGTCQFFIQILQITQKSINVAFKKSEPQEWCYMLLIPGFEEGGFIEF